MIQTLIVDDEPLFREGFRKTVDWQSLGFSIRGEAIDGQEALDLLKNIQNIDLIFTDIRMPVMDGLELIREIRKKDKRLYIVVLSAYDDFPLVRQAFRAGANDYLLKDDFDSNDIMEIASDITAYRKMTETVPAGFSFRDRLFGERILLECITGVLDPSAYVSLSAPEETHSCQGLSVAAVRIDTKRKWETVSASVRTACSAAAADCGISCSLVPKMPYVCVLVERDQTGNSPGGRTIQFGRFHKTVQEYLAKTEQLQQGNKPVITMGVSGGNSISRLEQYWNECCYALNSSVIWGRGGIITLEQAESREYCGQKKIDRENRIRLLSSYIENWDFLHLAGVTGKLALDPHFCSPNQIQQIRELFHAYYIILSVLTGSCPAADTKDFRNCLEQYRTTEPYEPDLPSLNSWLRITLTTLAGTIGGSSQLVRQVVGRINAKYASVISVKALASFFSVNASYLSRLCTAELGMPLSEYITRIRINKACVLMKQGGRRLYEIAEAVGFPNQETFTRTFKRIRGITPKEFFSAQKSDKVDKYQKK